MARWAGARGDGGAVLPLVAFMIVVLMVMTSMTIDIGRLSLRRRDLQAVADVVSLDLVRLVDGRTAGEIQGDPSWAATLAASRARNNFAPSGDRTLQALLGCYTQATDTLDTGCAVPDAVRVIAGDTVPFYFQAGERTTSRSAVGQRERVASFSVGSTLAELDTGNSALLNGLLSDLLGTNVAISAVGYQGLATADVSLADLAATGGFGTVDGLLAADLTAAEFSAIAAQALTNDGDLAAAGLFGSELANSPNNQTFQLGDFITVAPGAPDSAEEAQLNLVELLLAGAEVANGSNFLDFSDAVDLSGLGVPGVGAVTTESSYQVIENPQIAIGPVGSRASTAQLEVGSVVTIPIAGLDIPTVGLLDGSITIPVQLSGAQASALLTRIDCNEPETDSLIDVGTALRALTGNLSVSGTLSLPLVPVIQIAGTDTLSAAPPAGDTLLDIFVTETRSTAGDNLDLGGLSSGDVTVSALGLPPATIVLIRDALLAAINPVLDAVAAALQPALNALGVETAEADVTNLSVVCGGPILAG